MAVAVPTGGIIDLSWGADLTTQFNTVQTSVATLVAQTLSGVKTGDTARSSDTTLTADPDLQLVVEANRRYQLEAMLTWTSGTAEDFKFDILLPSGGQQGSVATWFVDAAAGSQLADTRMWTTGEAVTIPGAGGTFATQRRHSHISGTVLIGGTAGTFAIRWAQATSGANNTTMRSGSYVKLTALL